MNLRNPVTRHMKEWGYGQGYQHAHQFEDAIVDMDCLPPSLAGRRYYFPTGRGLRNALRRGWKRSGGSGRRVSRKTGLAPQSAIHHPHMRVIIYASVRYKSAHHFFGKKMLHPVNHGARLVMVALVPNER